MHKSYPEIMSSIVQDSKPSFQTLKAWFHVRISLIQLAQGWSVGTVLFLKPLLLGWLVVP